jgi:hypothetical protein
VKPDTGRCDIQSLNDPVTRYVPELAGRLSLVGSRFKGRLRRCRHLQSVIYVNPSQRLVIVKSSANHAYGTGRGYDETKGLESTHLAFFKAIETALSNSGGGA